MCVISHFRQVFPCGLVQPAGAFRASVDALLLARFVSVSKSCHFADLGTGCGIVACALALAYPSVTGVGLERETVLVEAARQNIGQLRLETQLDCVEGDVRDTALLARMGAGIFDVVVTNPPYRISGQGRATSQGLRRAALEADTDSLGDFFAAGAQLLKHHGRLACILPAARLGDAVQQLRANTLGLRRLRCVHTKAGGPATRVLLEARKHAAEDIRIETPLLSMAEAREGHGANTMYNTQKHTMK